VAEAPALSGGHDHQMPGAWSRRRTERNARPASRGVPVNASHRISWPRHSWRRCVPAGRGATPVRRLRLPPCAGGPGAPGRAPSRTSTSRPRGAAPRDPPARPPSRRTPEPALVVPDPAPVGAAEDVDRPDRRPRS
jgi:hypothetical protein